MSGDLAAGAAAAQAISIRLTLLAEGMDAAATALPAATSGWSGPAATAAAQLLDTRPQRFRAVAVACRAAAATLSRHAEALGPAVALRRQSGQAPAELATVMERRAADLVDESARLAARSLLALAESAPPRPHGWHGRLDRVNSWRAEVMLGAAESTEALASTALKVLAPMTNPLRRRSPDDVRRAGAAVVEAVRHPVEFGKAVLDWDTWQANPARAAGHLLPDAVAAIGGGATAASVRASTATGRSRAAAQVAAARDALRREATGAAATAARRTLIRRAEAEALARIKASGARVAAWHGEGGARLTALQNAGVEAYHWLSTARERSLTAIMHEVSQAARGELSGLDHRLKTPDSAKRKLAIEHARTGGPLADLLAKAADAVRYSVVITDASYVRGVAEVAASLERRGFHARSVHNAWHGPRYRGINSVWVDPATGAAFEVQFHTPASYRITKRTHRMYEEFRLPGISPVRKAELHERIAAQYRTVPVPGWVEVLQGKNFPPPSAPDPITPPANYTVHAVVGGAAAIHLGVTEPRVRPGTP